MLVVSQNEMFSIEYGTHSILLIRKRDDITLEDIKQKAAKAQTPWELRILTNLNGSYGRVLARFKTLDEAKRCRQYVEKKQMADLIGKRSYCELALEEWNDPAVQKKYHIVDKTAQTPANSN